MTRNEVVMLWDWLSKTYPRNYKNMDPAAVEISMDNMAYAFKGYTFPAVMAEYRHKYLVSKTEPHPSEIRSAIKAEVKQATKREDPYEVLRRHPKWDEFCRAYGNKECVRQAKICVETATVDELKFRLEREQ